MLTRNELKFIKSLQLKKCRNESGKFLVEGEKNVIELLKSGMVTELVMATAMFIGNNPWIKNIPNVRIIETTAEILAKTGSLVTNDAVLAVVHMPSPGSFSLIDDPLVLIFDNLRDPGNLGTLLRIADWYGIHSLILSQDSVDAFNPKVIQGSMGSFLRVRVYYEELSRVFDHFQLPLIGTFSEGSSIYDFNFPGRAMILFGNESQGISNQYHNRLGFRIAIPKVGGAESLNVAVSAAIVIDNFMRSNR